MSLDFDSPPIYDALTKKRSDGQSILSDNWCGYMASFYQNLISFLGQNGVFLPQLTMTQRDEIQSPQNGQMIYNTTLNSAQYFKNGSWSSF